MQTTREQAAAGQAVYTKPALSAYDIIVLGISNRFIWKCPTPVILDHYNRNVSSNHLDVGVGTGYFLDRCRFPSHSPRLALMDMNPNTLAFTSKRISRYKPEVWRQNILENVVHSIEPFDSVGVNYLFHCLPGSFEQKAAAFDHLTPLMKPGARIFGSTILQGDGRRGWTARKLMAFYNGKGIFSNGDDDLDGLERALSRRFTNVMLRTVGCVALFAAELDRQ